MRRWLFLAVSAACFFGSWWLIFAAWPSSEPELPELWVDSAVVDQGDLFQGQESRTEFVLVNHYSELLEITEVIKGCTCSEATIAKKHLAAGEKTSLNVAWKTGRMRGRNSVGLEVMYKLANGAQFQKSLQVQANVVPDIVCDPEQVTFDGTKREIQTIRLTSGRMKAFTISGIDCNHSAFKAELRDSNVVEITFDGTTPVFANGLNPRVIVQTDSPNEPQIHVPLEFRSPRPTQ